MKAVICNQYGAPKVLKLENVDKPRPENGQVLVRVHASSITTADTMMRKGKPFYGRLFIGLLKPKVNILGTGFSGVIEAVGEGVDHFRIGESVLGEIIFASGTNTEYVCVSENQLIFNKPESISHTEAASIGDGLVTSLSFLTELTNLNKGQRVLINGASGGLGTAAVQIARELGAHVTAICSTKNSQLVLSLGADKIIDYTQDKSSDELKPYDVIYDTIGSLSFSRYKKNLIEGGVFVSPVLSVTLLLHCAITAMTGANKKAKFSATGLLEKTQRIDLFTRAIALLESKKVRQVIDRTYKIDNVKQAHCYLETGRKVGNLALVI